MIPYTLNFRGWSTLLADRELSYTIYPVWHARGYDPAMLDRIRPSILLRPGLISLVEHGRAPPPESFQHKQYFISNCVLCVVLQTRWRATATQRGDIDRPYLVMRATNHHINISIHFRGTNNSSTSSPTPSAPSR